MMRWWLMAVWILLSLPAYPALSQSLHHVDERRLHGVISADFEALSRQYALCHLYVLYQSVVTLEAAGCREIKSRPIKTVRLDLMQRVVSELQRRREQRLYSDDQCHYEFTLANGETEVGIISLRSAYEIENAIENVQAALDLRAMLSSNQRPIYPPYPIVKRPTVRSQSKRSVTSPKIPRLPAPRLPAPPPKDDEIFTIDDVIPLESAPPASRAPQ